MTAEWLEPHIDRLEELAGQFARFFHARMDGCGDLSPSQYYLLRCLDQSPRLTVSELAQALSMTVPGATSLLDRPVRNKWVIRRRDRQDRRIVRLSLTPEGRGALTEARTRRREIMAELIGALEPAEVQTLLQIYEKIAACFPGMQVNKAACFPKLQVNKKET